MAKTRVGLVGCGNISDVYIANSKMSASYEIVACADQVRERAEAKASANSIPISCSVREIMNNPEVELILNLTNPQSHSEIDLMAIKHGKSVYSEKPLATSVADGKRILATAARSGLRIGCAPDTFLGGRIQTMRKLLDEGAIGDPVAGVAFMACHGHESWHPEPEFYYKKGAGPLFDMGPYYLTALVTLLGSVRRVTGFSRVTFKERVITSEPLRGQGITVEVPTHIAGTLEFSKGCIVSVIMSFDVWDSSLPRLEIYGTAGTMSLKDPDPLAGPNIFGGDTWLRRSGDSDWNAFPHELPRKAEPTEWERIAPQFPHTGNSRGVGLEDMVVAIAAGVPHRASGAMAFHVLEIIEALLKASEDRHPRLIRSACERPRPLQVRG